MRFLVDMVQVYTKRDEAMHCESDITSSPRPNKMVTGGICGQASSDYPDFAAFLVEAGIDSIPLNPDSVVRVRRRVAEEQARIGFAPSPTVKIGSEFA